jgi:PTH1 family peptidyl-tRNA hydrolase
VLIVVDDVNLPLGKLRFRKSGSAGGHNGLKSITERLGTEEFPRLRIGVGLDKGPGGDLVQHVLGAFSAEERPQRDEAVGCAAEAVLAYLDEGIARAMNAFN